MLTYIIKRKNDEIDELLNMCADAQNTGESKYPGMTYEQGIEAALMWAFGESDAHPLREE